ncbi:MAG: methylmalonyl-CoA mutase family protein [Hyphomonadaceae bacterium]
MADSTLQLGEPADEADWRALVEQGLRGAQWQRLVGQTADGVAIQPLYREPDIHTATDVSGMPGATPFVRGARAGDWRVRQAYEHPDPAQTNADILADLQGGVAAIELVVDPTGARGVAITDARDLDLALADVILEAAPVSLDAGARGLWAAELLESKLKGVAARGTAFNLDPIGALMRTGAESADTHAVAALVERLREALPDARVVRADARPVHEAGGTEAQEIAAALSCGIAYLRMAGDAHAASAGAWMQFAVSVGPDVLIETAKLRALRLCWARVLEASGAPPEARAAHIHAFTSRRMMTRHDAWTNILRVSTAAFAAGIGGADDITTYPLTDALGLPTPFARRVARNTQHVLLEECRLGHVADPAGGAWFVEKLTRDLAARAWALMQDIERQGGIVAAFQSGRLQGQVATARAARQKLIATRRETITGVTDFPLLGATMPEFLAPTDRRLPAGSRQDAGAPLQSVLAPIRWVEPFETLRDRAEAKRARVFFAPLGPLADFGPRAQWARNLLGAGGVAAVGAEEAYASMDALTDAFRQSGARVALIAGADAAYAEHAVNCAQRLKAAGAGWVVLAGKLGERETHWRAAGVDQFVHAGHDALAELETLLAALGIGP